MRSEYVSLNNRVRISDVCEVFDGPHATPKKTEHGPVYLGIDSITDDGHINPAGFNHLSSDDFKIWTKRVVPQENDVVFTYEATLGRYALIPKDFYGCLGRRIALVRTKDDRINPRWLLYYFLSPSWKGFIDSRTVIGSTVNRIPIKAFPDYEIEMPPRSVQDKIASILGDIDDRIVTNKKINDNLLQQALAIFTSWFIRFDQFSGITPENWEITSLDNLCSLISRGITPKYDDASDQIVINQKCIRNHMLDLLPARCHRPKVVNEKWLKYGDLLINSTGEGTLGRSAQVYFEPHNMTVDSHVTIVRPAQKHLIFYVGIWGLLHERQIEALHTGSTGQTELPRERLKSMEILLPDRDTLIHFDESISPLAQMIVRNQRENARLASLRDSLLPRLMSGEIDVSSITL